METTPEGSDLVLCCGEDNDLLELFRRHEVAFTRVATPGEAVKRSPRGAGVMILAETYPAERTRIGTEVFEDARARGVRLYVEYPAEIPDLEVGPSRTHKKGIYGANIDREVITSEEFGFALKKWRIVLIHGCHYVPVTVDAAHWHIATARVSGCDTAVFGLPSDDVWPILFEHPAGGILVATTKLSQFRTARYAPADAWPSIWSMILRWVRPEGSIPELEYTPTVRPAYGRAAVLPTNAQRTAMERGVGWFGRSGLFIDPSGKEGFHEGFNSKEIYQDGRQAISPQVRTDCHGEVSMTMALGARLLRDPRLLEVAANLNDAIYFTSPAAKGPRLQPASPSYGLIGGDMKPGQTDLPFDLVTTTGSDKHDGAGVYYGDDAARHVLGSAVSAAILSRNDWDERMLMELLANFRTTGPWGFRKARLEEPEIQEMGWRHFWEESDGQWGEESPSPCVPHYAAYLWAVFLWLYDKTGFKPLLERTERGIRNMMYAYPDGWGSANNCHETERCRMLLPLAWLLRVADTPEHREWLREIVEYVLAAQHASGAIRHRLIDETTTNEQYGTAECALVQSNSDSVADMLYATNFALLGLHEAAAVTMDPAISQAEDRLTDFLMRIQIRSETHPELDGGWYRGFDFKRWDYWGSDGDHGWGLWAIETGWTVGWIASTMAMREMGTCLWDLTAKSTIGRHMEHHRPVMLPDDALSVPLRHLR